MGRCKNFWAYRHVPTGLWLNFQLCLGITDNVEETRSVLRRHRIYGERAEMMLRTLSVRIADFNLATDDDPLIEIARIAQKVGSPFLEVIEWDDLVMEDHSRWRSSASMEEIGFIDY